MVAIIVSRQGTELHTLHVVMGAIWIGGDFDCHVPLEVEGVQLAMWRHDGRYYVADVATGRTLLNGAMLVPQYRSREIRMGDVLTVEDYELKLAEPDRSALDAPTQPRFEVPPALLGE